jgi:hypothetical protein
MSCDFGCLGVPRYVAKFGSETGLTTSIITTSEAF